jgi:hypothetical protein
MAEMAGFQDLGDKIGQAVPNSFLTSMIRYVVDLQNINSGMAV